MTTSLRHWLKFNAVGVVGVGVQLAVLAGLKFLGMNYLLATLLAVEATILHNFVWHEYWTWRDREKREASLAMRLVRFNAGNGIVSLTGNLGLMWLLVSRFHIHYLAANLLAIVLCSLVNFFVSDRLVFHTIAL